MTTTRTMTTTVLFGTLAVGLAACSTAGEPDELKIAFLAPSVSNTYITETRNAMAAIAEQEGATLTEFDAQFDVARQQEQLQNIVTSGQYHGIVISPMTEAVAPDIAAAAAAGIRVVVVGNILGTRLDTSDPQVEGVDLSVVPPQTSYGEGLGVLAKEACESKDLCRVVYFFGIKGTPNETAWYESFTASIASEPSIEIVAEPESQYTADVALAAMQNVLQSTPDFEVVIGTDQAMQGVQIALEQVGTLDGVALIGVGGSEAAVAQVAAGTWFGGFMTAPQTEGELAINGMIELLRDGELSTPAGLNPLDEIPNGGVFTIQNVDQIEPQWKG